MTVFPTGMLAKITPVDADVVLLADSADWNNPKKVTMANVKAYVWWGGWTWDVVWPASSTANHVALFSDTSGKLIKDWWALPTWDVVWPVSSTDWKFALFSWISWKIIKEWLTLTTTIGSPWSDTNIPSEKAVRTAISWAGWWDVSWPSWATSDHLAVFDWISGKLIKDWGVKPTWDIVWPASAVDWHLCVFDTTTWKLIKDWWVIPAWAAIASSAEVDTWTDNAKIVTAAAISGSHNVPNVVPWTSWYVMTSNWTDWISSPSSGWGWTGTLLTKISVRKSTWQNCTSWITVITFDTEDFDTNNEFASNIFTVTTAWYYEIICSLTYTITNAWTDNAQLYIYKNTSTLIGSAVQRLVTTNTNDRSINISKVLYLSTNDTIGISAYFPNTASVDVSTWTYLQIIAVNPTSGWGSWGWFNDISSTTYTSWLLTQFTWDTVVYDVTYDNQKRTSTVTNWVSTWTVTYTNGKLTGLSKA